MKKIYNNNNNNNNLDYINSKSELISPLYNPKCKKHTIREIELALARYRKEADEAELSAGYSGEMSDGGADRMRQQADAFEAGLKGIVPDFLKDILLQVQRENDSEYAKYLELKKKFESR